MSKFDIDEALIRKLAKLLKETGLTEIEFETDDARIRVNAGASGPVIAAAPAIAAPAAIAAGARPPPTHRPPDRSPRRWSAPPICRRSRMPPPS